MATAHHEVIDLCSSDSDGTRSNNTNNNDNSGGDSGRSTTTSQPSKVYMVIHDRHPSLSLAKVNCAIKTDRQQDHTVIVSVHFLLADAIGAAEDYVRAEFDVDADMDEDDFETERELDRVDWSEDGWLHSDDNNLTDPCNHRVYILEKPVS